MSIKYTIMFTAGGRSGGAKIDKAEKNAMYQYIAKFRLLFPNAIIHEALGLAEVELTKTELALLESDPNIFYIREYKTYKLSSTVQINAPWHLSNVSNSQYNTYEYTLTGKNIPVYVLDTGIDTTHVEFENRALKGMFRDIPTNMHGTHVAGIIGSKTYGVAKKCTLISVQIFDPAQDAGIGADQLYTGLEYVLTNHDLGFPGVVNLSISGTADDILDQPLKDSILALITEGLIVVVSAGNDAVDVANVFPAKIPEVITVGAIDNNNKLADFSNWGPLVDIHAPGVDITSTTLNGVTDTISGTSMAAPVVAGICAAYLELCPNVTPTKMQQRLIAFGASNVDTGIRTTTTAVSAKLNIPGIIETYQGTLTSLLTGQYRQYYYIGTTKHYENDVSFGVIKRLAVLQQYGLIGTKILASEISKTTLPVVTNPTVTPPLMLPPSNAYDNGLIVFQIDFSVTFKGVTYQPTSYVNSTYGYNYPGILVFSVEILPNNVFKFTSVSQLITLPDPISYDGATITMDYNRTLSFKGVTYTPTTVAGLVYTYDYPGVLFYRAVWAGDGSVVVSTTTQIITPVITPPNVITGGIIPLVEPEKPEPPLIIDAMSIKMYPKAITLKETSPKRVIAIDVQEPNKLTAYSINMQFSSGTFNYSGIDFIPPKNKAAATVQSYNGIVERITKIASRGQAPITVEGRLLPLFTCEMIYIKKFLKKDGTPYETKTIIAEIATLAGTTVKFSATNNKVKSFEFTGRFTQALEQLADLSCGRLLQQNGNWMILPKFTSNGNFIVSKDNVISWQLDTQSDILDKLASLLGYLKDAILALDQANRLKARAQDKLDHVSTLEKLPTDPAPKTAVTSNENWQFLGEIAFTFGWSGKSPLVKLADNILVEAPSFIDAWTQWDPATNPVQNTDYFWKVEPTYERDKMGKTTKKMRGLKSIEMVKFYYPFTPPSNASSYRASGVLHHLYCTLWAGDKNTYDSMSPVTKTQVVTAGEGVTAVKNNQVQYYWEFERAFLEGVPLPPGDDRNFYSARLNVEYLPTTSIAWKFTVTIDKTYRILSVLNYLIPLEGGAVLNKNGNTVAQFDRTARVIKLQDGTIVSKVLCRPDIPPIASIDPITGLTKWSEVVKGDPYQCDPPDPTPGGRTVTITGPISDTCYVLKTKAGRLFGSINKETGAIQDISNKTIGTYSYNNARPVTGAISKPLWSSNELGYVNSTSMLSYEIVGVVVNAMDSTTGGVIHFNNSVSYPSVTPDTNYASMLTTLAKNELANANVDIDTAKAKIACIKKELDYYGVSYENMEKACAKWKIYYDAIEVRDFPKITVPPEVPAIPATDDQIATYETEAIAATGLAMKDVVKSNAFEEVTTVTILYDNVLPLAGQSLTVGIVTGTPMIETSDIIETVAFNGQTVTITAKKGGSLK